MNPASATYGRLKTKTQNKAYENEKVKEKKQIWLGKTQSTTYPWNNVAELFF